MNVNRQGDVEIITDYTQEEWLKLRSQDITSTDAAALFGISPYLTPFELWHRKKSGLVIELEPSIRMKWGTRLQDSIAAGIAEDQGWEVRRMSEYIRHVKRAMGASFDFEFSPAEGSPDPESGLLEIKNVDALAFKDGWILDGDHVEAPAHIELQIQHQLAVSGNRHAYIGALIGGNRVVLIRRERDEKVIAALETKIDKFWYDIDHNIEPKPDFVKDADFIKTLYKFAEPGKIFDAAGNIVLTEMVKRYKAHGAAAKEAKDQQDALKAQLLIIFGDAEKVFGDGWTISAGMIGPTHVEYDRQGYRDFRVFAKKIKEAVNA